MNTPASAHTPTVPTIFGLSGCVTRLRRRHTRAAEVSTDRGSPEPQRVRSKVTQQEKVTRPWSRGCCGSGEPRSGVRSPFGLLALAITILVVALPITSSRADSVSALANLTGASTSTCQSLLTDLASGDPSTLLDSLTPGEAEELLELIAHLAGLTPIRGTHTVGIAKPAFRDMAEALEDGIPDHLWYGQIFLDIRYADTNRIPGQVVDIVPVAADSGIWSGHYLAAEAFRYAIARRKMAKGNQSQASVWG